jgi:spore germination cell wall hydrolase CwlJ-like protein
MEGRNVVRAALVMLMVSAVVVPGCCWAREKERSVAVVSVVAKRGDVDLVAETAFYEARSEGFRGMSAVAHVIVNRHRKDPEAFGGSIREVVLRQAQFSVWNRGGAARRGNPRPGDEHYELARKAAWQAMTGVTKDPTGGATYYYERSIRPGWARRMVVTARIGRHVFLKPRGG